MIEQLQASLGDAYTLERELGGGGMSRVFVAYERRLERRVVVKVLSPDLAASVSVERFEREMRLAASLSQANIVPLLTAGATNGLPYYTMPLVEGETLRSRLAQSGLIPIHEVVGVLRDVARALAYAHERGVVHRDIKPDNVLLSGGTAVVTDFGIAKAIWSARTEPDGAKLTQTGLAIGTPAYMSPEQVAGDPAIDHRADLYSISLDRFLCACRHRGWLQWPAWMGLGRPAPSGARPESTRCSVRDERRPKERHHQFTRSLRNCGRMPTLTSRRR